MEFDDNEAFTPRGSKKKTGSKTASSIKKFVTRRLTPKGVSSERALTSGASLDSDTTQHPSRLFLFRHRRAKTREVNASERGAATDRPRRSLSVGDMAKMGEEETTTTLKPLEADLKAKKVEFHDTAAALESVAKKTPVVVHHVEATEPKVTKEKKVAAKEVKEETPLKKKIKEIEAEESSATFGVSPDAAATIDAGIEDTVMASLKVPEPAKKPEVEAKPKSLEVIDAAVKQREKDTRKATVAGKGVKTKTRELNPTELAPKTGATSVQKAKPTSGQAKKASKPKRRRFGIVKSASFSLATLAVGLLIVIFKNKH